MIFENRQNIELQKVAISYENKQLTYAQLFQEIQQRAAYFNALKNDFLLCHENALENLLNFLSVISIGKKAVFGGSHLTINEKTELAKAHQLEIVTETISLNLENSELFKPYISKKTDLFLGVISSGSTGTPKIIWKDYNAWFSAFPHQSAVFNVSKADKVFVLDALGYSANLNTALHTLWMGGGLYLGKLKEAKSWPKQFEVNNISSVFMVPSHYRLLVANKPVLPAIKSMVSAGEKLDSFTATQLLEVSTSVLLTEYYGAAELGHIAFQQNQDIISNPQSVGKAFPEVKIEIKENKIWVKSPFTSPDYRNKPTVHDFGYIDDSQRLILLGREGRMFNRRGLNIFAEEIENAALIHPTVTAAAAIQKNHKNHRATIHLFIANDANLNFNKKEFQDFLLSKLGKAKMPNKIIPKSELLKLESGKINFKVLQKILSEDNSINI